MLLRMRIPIFVPLPKVTDHVFLPVAKCTLMLNFTVYNRSDRRTLVPWRIHGVNPPDISFRGFYHNEATRFIEGGSSASRLELQSTFVGASKESMDLVDSSLKAMDVISVFGPYTKFIVEEIGGECSAGEHYIEYL